MPSVLSSAIRGAADVAVPALLAEHKAQILAERDARLQEYKSAETKKGRQHATSEREAGQSFRTDERIAGQEFKSKERAAGEEFKAGESEKDRASREEIAKTRAGTFDVNNVKVVDGRIYDLATGEVIDLPANRQKLWLAALSSANKQYDSLASFEKEKTSVEELALNMFATSLEQVGGKGKPKPKPLADMTLEELQAELAKKKAQK